MKKLLICVVPIALAAAHASAAPSAGWGGIGGLDLAAGTGAGKAAPLVLVQRGGGGRAGGVNRGGGGVNRGNVNRGNFNSGNFQRDVSGNRNVSANRNVSGNVNVNRNVNVSGNGSYYGGGPNWGGVAAGVAVGAGVAAIAGVFVRRNSSLSAFQRGRYVPVQKARCRTRDLVDGGSTFGRRLRPGVNVSTRTGNTDKEAAADKR